MGDHGLGFQQKNATGMRKDRSLRQLLQGSRSNVGAAAGCDLLIWRFIRQPAHPRANLAKMPAFSTYTAGTAVSKESDRLFAQPLAQVPDFAFNEDCLLYTSDAADE